MPQPLYPRLKERRYPFTMRLGGPKNRSGRHAEIKILDPTGTGTLTLGDPLVILPIASRCADCSIPALRRIGAGIIICLLVSSTGMHWYLVAYYLGFWCLFVSCVVVCSATLAVCQAT
jgi:hypothetical protein